MAYRKRIGLMLQTIARLGWRPTMNTETVSL